MMYQVPTWLSLRSLCAVWPHTKAAAGVVALQHHLVLAAATGLCGAFHALRLLLHQQLPLLVRVDARLLSRLQSATPWLSDAG